MNDTQFQAIVELRCKKIKSVLASKAKEYARQDRLSNFKKASALMGVTPATACMSFWMKHIVSIVDLVNDYEKGTKASPEMWNEKLGDAINYLVLLEAIVSENIAPSEGGR